MLISEKTGREVCYLCERELSENGIPAGLSCDEHVRRSPWISAFKATDSAIGYDTLNTSKKDFALVLETHCKSPLHVQALHAIAARFTATYSSPTAGVSLALNARTQHNQLKNIMQVAMKIMQSVNGSQLDIEQTLFLVKNLGVPIGTQEHSRKTAGQALAALVAKMADDQLREHLDTVNPYTHKRPYFGWASDKYSTKTGKSFLLSDIKISMAGRGHILFNDLALVPEKWHLEEDNDGHLGIDLDNDQDNDEEEESTTTTIPGGSAYGLYNLAVGGGSDMPLGKKTLANYRDPRGLEYRVTFGNEDSQLGDPNDGQHRLAGAAGDGENVVSGETNGLMAYFRGPNGLNCIDLAWFWDLAHQLQLNLKELQSQLNASSGNIYNDLYYLARKGQQFTKQSSSRCRLLSNVGKELSAFRVLRLRKVRSSSTIYVLCTLYIYIESMYSCVVVLTFTPMYFFCFLDPHNSFC